MKIQDMFDTMTASEITRVFNSAEAGSKWRITYFTECTPCAATKREGKHLFKVTSLDIVIGLDYNTLPEVIEKRSREDYKPSDRAPAYESVVPNRVLHGINGGKLYAQWFYPTNGESLFLVDKVTETYITKRLSDEDKALAVPSYWTRRASGEKPIVQNCMFEHILSVKPIA